MGRVPNRKVALKSCQEKVRVFLDAWKKTIHKNAEYGKATELFALTRLKDKMQKEYGFSANKLGLGADRDLLERACAHHRGGAKKPEKMR